MDLHTVRSALEALLDGAAFDYEQGNTRQLIKEARQALLTTKPVSLPTTFYYSVKDGGYRMNRRLVPRSKIAIPH